jgi:hypothetical protein
MSLQGEIITAFVAAVGTIATTVGLVAYLLRDLRAELKGEIQDLRTELRSEFHTEIGELRAEVRQVLVELLHHVQTGHHPPPHAA